jgi:hypothetical protein
LSVVRLLGGIRLLAEVKAVGADEKQTSSLYIFVRTRFLIPLKAVLIA